MKSNYSIFNKKLHLLLILLVIILQACSYSEFSSPYSKLIKSPNNKIACKISLEQDKAYYQLVVNGDKVVEKSSLGLVFNTTYFENGFEFLSDEVSQKDTTWHPVYGKNSAIHDNYNQLAVTLSDKSDENRILKVYFRMYNDGVAFRYELPQQSGFDDAKIIGEKTTFSFAKDYTAWSVLEDIEWANPGPLPLSKHNNVKLPVTIDAGDCWLSVNEAALFNYSPPIFTSADSSLVKTFSIDTVSVDLPLKTPWRVIQVAENAPKLIESDILLNLNEPSKIEDTSWIIPGKCMWDWRCIGAKVGDFTYGINSESFKRYIDFASENKIKYVLYDAAWRVDVAEEMPGLIKYAKSKGVGICLYFDRQRTFVNTQLEDVIETYAKWGAIGIKYGFLVREPEVKEKGMAYFVQRGQEIVELCAKHKMHINFHDNIYHPSGDERTWPHITAREYCWANQDHKDSFLPFTAATVPFVNNLSGGLDITNGFYEINDIQNREKCDKKGLFSTVVSETARCMVMWAPMLILGDHGDAYNAKADLFEFIKEMPDTWDETIGLDGYPGEFITVARRIGEEWFVASVNNEEKREIDVPLNFLGEGEYKITLYADSLNTHYKTNKETYQITTKMVTQNDVVKVKMAAGGGHCMWIRVEE